MTIQPIGQRVLLKRIKAEEKTTGGIYLPDTAASANKPNEAEVVALGTGGHDEDGKPIPFNVAVGDHVIMTNYGGTEITFEGEKFTIINEVDLLAVIKK